MNSSDLPNDLRRLCQFSPGEENHLKAGVDLEYVFHQSLTLLTWQESKSNLSMIWSYRLAELDEETRDDLKDRARAAMASPRETEVYHLAMETNPGLGEEFAAGEERPMRGWTAARVDKCLSALAAAGDQAHDGGDRRCCRWRRSDSSITSARTAAAIWPMSPATARSSPAAGSPVAGRSVPGSRIISRCRSAWTT